MRRIGQFILHFINVIFPVIILIALFCSRSIGQEKWLATNLDSTTVEPLSHTQLRTFSDTPQLYFPTENNFLLIGVNTTLFLADLEQRAVIDSFTMVSNGSWRFMAEGRYAIHRSELASRLNIVDPLGSNMTFIVNVPKDTNDYDVSADGSKLVLLNRKPNSKPGYDIYSLPDYRHEGHFEFVNPSSIRSVKFVKFSGDGGYVVALIEFYNPQWAVTLQLKLQTYSLKDNAMIGELSVNPQSWAWKIATSSFMSRGVVCLYDLTDPSWDLRTTPKLDWVDGASQKIGRKPKFFFYPTLRWDGLYYLKIHNFYEGEYQLTVWMSSIDRQRGEFAEVSGIDADGFKCDFVGTDRIAAYNGNYTIKPLKNTDWLDIQIYDLPQLDYAGSLRLPDSTSNHLFSRDGRYIATAEDSSAYKSVHIYEVEKLMNP